MARTDALAVEGFDAAVARCKAYSEAGADMLFPEAFTELDQYRQLRQAIDLPVLANITEFGKTPLFASSELGEYGVDIVLYPLSAARAMWKAARSEGEQCRQPKLQVQSHSAIWARMS